MNKKLASLILVLIMVCACAGCGSSKGKLPTENSSGVEVIKIGGENITLDFIYLYTIQYIYTYGVNADAFSGDMDNYKSQILSQLRSDEIQYQKAKQEGIELTDAEKEEMNQVVDRYYKTFTEKLLGSYGITKEAVTELFMKQRYLTKLNDETTKELEKEYRKEAEKAVGDKDFYELYYLLFPTVEYDDNGSPKTDENGKYIEYSKEDKEKQKKLAEEAKIKLEAGEEHEQLAEEYGIKEYSDTIRAFKGAYTGGLENLIADLGNGDISEIYEDDLGYMVVKMINAKDEDYKQYYLDSYASQRASEELENKKTEWQNAVELDSKKDFIGDTWDNLDLSEIAKQMEKQGIISAK
ncbi:MAG: peptidyl-prolyl cis-trans isomerase [Bacteroidales bacterium]|nr:peptidyl-prolyl cis-trans isomerase [Clostridium sp.]MCM1203715.1 peptidyl-prolyl cis-trans isomerase [Bacteroidales bacterium]